jgi:GT2 family glycosyltransferase
MVRSVLDAVNAVVLTYRRPHLAGDVVRSLVGTEGFAPGKVVVVVNGEGGLDDPALEERVHMLRLETNEGPAGGFRAGLLEAFADPQVRWAYRCEDDVGVLGLPAPRLSRLLEATEARAATGTAPVGAVVAYGRRFVGRGHAANFVPELGGPTLETVDVAAWGATLVSRAVLERGVLPDPRWFFGFEDFDFFCRLRSAGLEVLVDADSARAVADRQTTAGRDAALKRARPTDPEEPWRAYYAARNFFHLARAHGARSWILWHLAYSARRFQLASSNAERRAMLHGLFDGARGRLGAHPRYLRSVGERSSNEGGVGSDALAQEREER